MTIIFQSDSPDLILTKIFQTDFKNLLLVYFIILYEYSNNLGSTPFAFLFDLHTCINFSFNFFVKYSKLSFSIDLMTSSFSKGFGRIAGKLPNVDVNSKKSFLDHAGVNIIFW